MNENTTITLPGFTHYEVGKVTPSLAGPETIQFDFDDVGGLLIVRMTSPTKAEIDAFHASKPLRIGFVSLRNIIFVLSEFNGRTFHGDAPFTAHLAHNLTKLPEEVSDGMGYAVSIVLCGTDGMVYGFRLIALDTKTSRDLRREIISQLAMEDFNILRYDLDLSNIYMTHSYNKLASYVTHWTRIGGSK